VYLCLLGWSPRWKTVRHMRAGIRHTPPRHLNNLTTQIRRTGQARPCSETSFPTFKQCRRGSRPRNAKPRQYASEPDAGCPASDRPEVCGNGRSSIPGRKRPTFNRHNRCLTLRESLPIPQKTPRCPKASIIKAQDVRHAVVTDDGLGRYWQALVGR